MNDTRRPKELEGDKSPSDKVLLDKESSDDTAAKETVMSVSKKAHKKNDRDSVQPESQGKEPGNEVKPGGSQDTAHQLQEQTSFQTVPQRRGNGLAFFALLFGITGLSAAAYFGWQSTEINKNLTAKVSAIARKGEMLPQQFAGVDSRMSQLSGNIDVLDERSQQAAEQSESTASRFQLLVERVSEMNTRDRSVWLIAEAEYLMRLANQRLLMADDADNAKALLMQAEKLLTRVDEYGLFQVRQNLADDVAALNAVSKPDIESIWLQLNALGQRIYNLPLLSTGDVIKTLAHEEVTSFDDQEPAGQFVLVRDKIIHSLVSAWQSLLSQFRVRSNRTDFNPELLVPGEEQNLRHNLHLMLEQAKLALLKGDVRVYRESLNNVQMWINRWFLNTDAEAEAVTAQINEIKDINVEIILPDISGSLKSLQAYRKQKSNDKLLVPGKNTSGKKMGGFSYSSESGAQWEDAEIQPVVTEKAV